MVSGSAVSWDIDGVSGDDIDITPADCVNFLYEDCETGIVEIIATPRDRFGRAGKPISRSIQITCNELPVVTCVAFKNEINTPPIGQPGQTISFFISGKDPDRLETALTDDGPNGLTKFDVDYEGDGIFDLELQPNLQGLPHSHVYSNAGVFRPVIRGYDPDGDFGDTSCNVVTIFADSPEGGFIFVDGPVNAIVGLTGLASALPATTGIIAAADFGYSTLSQNAPGLHAMLSDNIQAVGQQPADLAQLKNAVFVANKTGGVDVLEIGELNNIDPAGMQFNQCFNFSNAEQVRVGQVVTDTTQYRLVVKNGSTLRVSDVTAIGTAGFDEVAGCSSFNQPLANDPLKFEAIQFGTGFSMSDYAVAASTVYVSVDGFPSGGTYGVAAYDLATTSSEPVCGSGMAGCLYTDQPVSAIAAQEQLMYSQFLNQELSGAPANVTYFALNRFAITEDTAARLWIDGVGYAATAATWWFINDSQIAVSGTTTYNNAQSVTFSAMGAEMIVFAQSISMSVYRVDGAGAGLTYSLKATAALAVGVDQLEISGQHLLFVNNTASYNSAGTDYPDRQQRGVYLAPVTAPERRIFAVPHRIDTSTRDRAQYEGPVDLSVGNNQAWVADGEQGVYVVDLQTLEQNGYPPQATAVVGLVSSYLDVGVGGVPESLRIPDQRKRGAVALGEGGSAVINFDVLPDSPFILPSLRYARLDPDPVVAADIVYSSEQDIDYSIQVHAHEVELTDDLLASGQRDGFTVPADVKISHAELFLDPDPDNFGIIYTFEQDTLSRTAVRFSGFGADGMLVPDFAFRAPDDFVGSAMNSSFGASPPVLGRLRQSEDSTRTLVPAVDGGGRICLEPFWGELCPTDPLTGGLVEQFKLNISGTPFPALVNGVPFLMFRSGNGFFMTFTDIDGIILKFAWSLCAELPAAELLPCSDRDTGGDTVHDVAVADPFLLISTNYALYIVDLSDPSSPNLVSRVLAGGEIRQVAGWAQGNDLAVAYTCTGSSFKCSGTPRVRTLTIRGVAGN